VDLARRAFPRLERLHEIPSFAEAAALQSKEPTSFLWTARLVDYKQPLRYLDLAQAIPDARFRMIAVETSETSPELRAELHSRVAKLANLQLLGPRSRAEVAALVDEAVAVVSTSRLEGMPNVFLEGWARGVPALSLEFDPDGRIATHGLGTAADGSFERFTGAARELWRTRDDRRHLASRIRSYVRETHSLDAVAERWVRVIEAAGRP
jgi:glycosyltransferase involved in cell wall biosynthesis